MVNVCECISEIDLNLTRIYKMQLMSGSGKLSHQIGRFETELQNLKTFWMYMRNWKGAGKNLLFDYYLLPDLEDAISKLLEESINATKNLRSMVCINDSILLPMWSKIKIFRSRIKEAYDCILKHFSIQSNSNSPISCCNLCQFCDSVLFDLHGLQRFRPRENKLAVKDLMRNLKSVQHFVEYVGDQCPENLAKKDLLTHLECGIICVAQISYLFCVDELDENAFREMMVMIHNVQKKLLPNTPEVTKIYLKVLEASMAQMRLGDLQTSNSSKFRRSPKSVSASYLNILEPSMSRRDLQTSNSSTSRETLEKMVNCFLNILMPFLDQLPQPSVASGAQSSTQEGQVHRMSMRKDGVKTLRQGLKCLITFLIDAPNLRKEDLEPVMIDIKTVAIEVGCIYYLVMEAPTKEVDIELFELLEKVEFLKAETMFLELLTQKANMILSVKDHTASVHDDHAFLGMFLEELGLTAKHGLILLQIQAVTMKASSLCHSFHEKEVTEETVKNGLFNLLDKVKLFKLGTLLVRLLNNKSSLMVPLKDQIGTLYNELIFLRTFLVGPLDENGKQILPDAQLVAREAASFYCSLHASEITEELVSKVNILVADLLKDIRLVKVEISVIYQQVRSSFRSNLPKINGLSFLDFLVGNLSDLMSSKSFSFIKNQNFSAVTVFFAKHHIQFIYSEIMILRSLFKENVRRFSEQLELKDLGLHIMNVAYESEYLIGSFVVKDSVLWYHFIWLSDLVEEIKLIKIQASRMLEKTEHDLSINNVSQTLRSTILSAVAPTPRIDGFVVDLADQAEMIVNRLNRGSLQRDVVSIVGMPGIGKTTLTRKLYTEASIIYHFHIRAWCLISQIYEKRKLLIDILSDINTENVDNLLEMSEEDLELELYQCLKGKRYLIVMDDMWSMKAWNDLERSFPNDGNGSRILITSRLRDVALNACNNPHTLRLLTDDESWTLLNKKVFHTDDCPEELLKIGRKIAEGCKGLPLAVVAIAGLLHRTNKAKEWWKQVADNLNSLIADDPQTRCMDILELSYIHLPEYLKPCFLYLGAFVDDKVIPVRKLKWLWIAEGFIQNTFLGSLEDAAEDYLMDLVNRSLVMVSKRSSRGNGVKACSVHNIFRDFCFARSREDNFLQFNNGYDELFPSSELDYGVDMGSYPSNSIIYEKQRLSICSKRKHFVTLRPSGPCVRSLLFFATSDMYPRCPYDLSFISSNFKLLRVLDIVCINMGHSFPEGIEFLVHLWYLSLSGDIDSVPSSIANLWNLETFALKGLKGKVTLPDTIWRMEKLRHVHVNCHTVLSLLDDDILEGSYQLVNLVTFSSPSFSKGEDVEKIIRMLPKLRRLRCIFLPSQDDSGNWNEFPKWGFLTELESLNIFYSSRIPFPGKLNLPLNLKKLTLSNFCLPWNLISEIGRLPNLEVLKLLSRAFEGKIWDMREGEFLKLKFLKLDTLNIAHWNASCDHFPSLEYLVLKSCKHLVEVPSDFVNMPTLQMIEMTFCSNSAEESVRRLKEEQLEMGIEELKVVINKRC